MSVKILTSNEIKFLNFVKFIFLHFFMSWIKVWLVLLYFLFNILTKFLNLSKDVNNWFQNWVIFICHLIWKFKFSYFFFLLHLLFKVMMKFDIFFHFLPRFTKCISHRNFYLLAILKCLINYHFLHICKPYIQIKKKSLWEKFPGIALIELILFWFYFMRVKLCFSLRNRFCTILLFTLICKDIFIKINCHSFYYE